MLRAHHNIKLLLVVFEARAEAFRHSYGPSGHLGHSRAWLDRVANAISSAAVQHYSPDVY